ncbi:MAG: fibronectin type III domain-containing protein [Candidatus Nanopelagicales bacterium]
MSDRRWGSLPSLVAAVIASTVCLTMAVAAPSTQASQRVSPRSAPNAGLGAFAPVTSAPPYGFGFPVTSLALGDDTLYVGGFFQGPSDDSMITSVTTTGGLWTPLGTGMGGVNGTAGLVKTLAYADDTLYAGGDFPNASGVAGTFHIAAWSNGSWHPMGSFDDTQTDTGILSLTTLDDTVYATGPFYVIGGVTAKHVAAWSDDTWHPLAQGLQTSAGGLGSSLAATDDTVYVSGAFTDASGVPGTSNIAAWADDTWHPLGQGLGPGTSLPDNGALATLGDTLYVGGTLNVLGVDDTSAMTRVAAWSGGSWHALGTGLNGPVKSLAADAAHGLLYAGGPFANPNGSDDTVIGQAWDEGIEAWIPLDDSTAVSPFDWYGLANAIAPDDSSVYIGGGFEMRSPSSYGITKWTWTAPHGAISTTSAYIGTSVPITGWGLIGVNAVRFGTTPATFTRDDSTSMAATVPNLAPGTYEVYVDAVGGTADMGSVTVVPTPVPPATSPPSAPREVTAMAGDASAAVAWVAPASTGSFPISSYQATASPGGKTCLVAAPALTCTITGLTNGTTYRITVTALNGAGWSPPSAPSNPVTPSGSIRETIIITGSRDARDARIITIAGTSTGLVGAQVTPWFRFPGQTSYTQGTGVRTVDSAGTFTWERRSGRKTYVYFTHDRTKSNTVVIPAR